MGKWRSVIARFKWSSEKESPSSTRQGYLGDIWIRWFTKCSQQGSCDRKSETESLKAFACVSAASCQPRQLASPDRRINSVSPTLWILARWNSRSGRDSRPPQHQSCQVEHSSRSRGSVVLFKFLWRRSSVPWRLPYPFPPTSEFIES